MIYTQVDDAQGPLTLTPTPTDGYDPQIDGLVTLAGATGLASVAGATGLASASGFFGVPLRCCNSEALAEPVARVHCNHGRLPQNLPTIWPVQRL